MIVSLRSGRTTRATLLGRIRDGVDTAAWRELDGVYREMLLRFCRSRGLQHADAEDVIQLVFVKLTVGLQRFEYDRTRGRFRDYLFRCVRSALSDWAACQSRSGSAVSLLEADRPVTLRSIAQDDRIRVLVLGRMDAAQKGLDMLMAHLLRETPERLARLHVGIVGEGPYRVTLESDRARHPQLAQCVTLEPWRPAAEVLGEYDLLFMPSRFEGVPLVMLEAMALGLPVVASDLPGTRAYVPAECLFAVGDLARALDIVLRLRSLEERQSLASQGRKTYERDASSAAFARRAAGLTRAISGRDRPVRAAPDVNATGA